MVIDDTPINLQLLTAMLTQRGFRVRPLTSGRAAIAAAQAEKPDLILLDVAMPDMNGYTTCERMKEIPSLKEVPILFLSALSQTDDKIRAFKAGGIDYITKPFLIEEVDMRINAHLRAALYQSEMTGLRRQLEEQVLERTQELDTAYRLLQQIDNMKKDFLLMIAHEMRTPSNGLLGLGDEILALCPDTPATKELKQAFELSRDRMLRVLDDSQYLLSMESSAKQAERTTTTASSFEAQIRNLFPDAQESGHLPSGAELTTTAIELSQLLTRAGGLARAFGCKQDAQLVKVSKAEHQVSAIFELPALSLNKEQCLLFFEVGSTVRSHSLAEGLGLSPVIAKRIAEQCGGSLRLEPKTTGGGFLVLSLPWC